MTSNYPAIQGLDYENTYNDIHDRERRSVQKPVKYTVGVWIKEQPEYSMFYDLIKRASLEALINNGHITLFVVQNKHIHHLMDQLFQMDSYDLRNRMVMYITNVAYSIDSLSVDEAMMIPTFHPYQSLFVTTDKTNSLLVNHRKITRGNVQCDNGLVHELEGLF